MGRLTSFLAGLAFIGSTAVTRAECAGTKFKSLVQFGDSYTDMARLHYFVTHNGTAPPVGWEQPDSNNTRSGGYIWGHYVSEWANVNVYDYAVSGAVCSNKITPKPFPILGRNFPSVAEYEIPAFLADSEYTTPSGDKFLDIPPKETVYSMWIGTNDLGVFLTGDQTPGKTIVDYLDCVYSALDLVYEKGGRNFILMNVIPLQLTPEYATWENHGVGPNLYWPDKPVDKMTVKSYEMFAEVTIANDLYRFRTPVEVLFANRYPGASFAVMDTHRLIHDIYYNPDTYLESPANVTGYTNHCNVMGQSCTTLPNPDSFLWYDPLHPSERTFQIVAEKFIDVMGGGSEWATYYGGW